MQSNAEFVNLKKILGLTTGKVYSNTSELRYSSILILADADVDGIHIR
jgi:DNA gyrase/topoisomerase IV subunit B